jgi:predicted permease
MRAGRRTVAANVVGPRYFDTLGIARRSGRDFDERDTPDGVPVAIVNEALAAREFRGDSPIGKRVSIGGAQGPWREIIGIVRDSAYAAIGEPPTPILYLPLAQNHETGVSLLVRTRLEPEAIADTIRREIQQLEPNLPVAAVQPARDVVGASLYPARMAAWLVGGFGAIAAVLAIIGVYGVLAFSISGRPREIGIRMALGARAGGIARLVVREGMTLVLIGLTTGLAVAIVGSRSLASFLYDVSVTDRVAFVGGPLLLAAVAAAACLIPARRATRVDPREAMRQ